jgi:hypothetical protein
MTEREDSNIQLILLHTDKTEVLKNDSNFLHEEGVASLVERTLPFTQRTGVIHPYRIYVCLTDMPPGQNGHLQFQVDGYPNAFLKKGAYLFVNRLLPTEVEENLAKPLLDSPAPFRTTLAFLHEWKHLMGHVLAGQRVRESTCTRFGMYQTRKIMAGQELPIFMTQEA